MSAAPAGRNPYVGPRPFETGERLYGRTRELKELLNLLIAERLVLLYSPSGAGKTSLVEAALRPALEREHFHVLPALRVAVEPPPALGAVAAGQNPHILSLLLSLETGLPPEQQLPAATLASIDLPAYLAKRRATVGNTGEEVLIFDQFEEILTADPLNRAAKVAFFEQVGEALRDPRRWALFALREDFLAPLDPYRPLLPTRLRTTYRLDLLGEAAARAAIQGPARAVGGDFTDAAAAKLVDDLRQVQVQRPDGSRDTQRGPYVEPVQLQVVCLDLWDRQASRTPGPPAIGEADLGGEAVGAQGTVDSALAAYYAARTAAIAAGTGVPERRIRDWVDRELISPQGLRGQVMKVAQQSAGLDNLAIQGLVDAHLVRAENRRDIIWFELAHDRLVAPVREDNARWRASHLSPLQQQAALWASQGRAPGLLMRDQALRDAERWAAAHAADLLPVEQEYLAAARAERRARRNRIILVAAIMGGIAVAFLSVILSLAAAVTQYEVAQRAQKTAEAQSTVAAENAATAVAQRNRADRAAATAEAERSRADGAAKVALSRQLAAQSYSRTADQLDLALLLSVAAGTITDTAEARASLFQALGTSPHLVAFLHPAQQCVRGVAFSPDGRLLALAGSSAVDQNGACVPETNDILEWDVASRQLTGAPLTNTLGMVNSLAFSPDGHTLAWGSGDGVVHLVHAGASESRLNGQTNRVLSLAFSPDGRLLAGGGEDHTLSLWDLPSGTLRRTLTGHTGTVTGVAFSPDGRTLASASQDRTVRLWDVATAQAQGSPLTGYADGVAGLAWSPDGHTLATASLDSRVLLQHFGTNVIASTTLATLPGPATSIAYSPNGRYLLGGSYDQMVRLWDLTANPPSATSLAGHRGAITAVAFSADGHTFASGSQDQPSAAGPFDTAILWDTAAAPPFGPLASRTAGAGVGSLAISPDGRQVAAGADDGTIEWWPVISASLALSATRAKQDRPVTGLAFSPDGATLASAGDQGSVALWDARTGVARSAPLTGFTGAVNGVAFSPDGRTLVAGGDDGTLRLWDAGTWAARAVLTDTAQSGPFAATLARVAFSPDGRLLAAAGCSTTAADGCPGGQVRLWDVATRRPVGNAWLGHHAIIRAVAFSPDGASLATGSDDATVILWDVATGQARGLPLQGHKAPVNAVSFSPDGHFLASASTDGTIRLWDAASGQAVGPSLTGHTDAVTGIAFSPDGRLLISGSADGTLKLWDTSVDSWRARACAVANRNLTAAEWAQYLPAGTPYQNICPALPASAGILLTPAP